MQSAIDKPIRLNTDTNLLKVVAIVTMFIDHAGKMLFPQYPIFRIIGRIAFPIFAYCLVVGCVYTHDMRRYVLRVGALFLISQPLYALALNHPITKPSILLTLLLGMLLIWTLRERRYELTGLMALTVLLLRGQIDYGLNGIVLMVLLYAFRDRPLLSLEWVLGFMVWWGMQGSGYSLFGLRFGLQGFAVLALPLIYLPTRTGLRVNKYLFYAFYPAHLLVIYLLDRML